MAKPRVSYCPHCRFVSLDEFKAEAYWALDTAFQAVRVYKWECKRCGNSETKILVSLSIRRWLEAHTKRPVPRGPHSDAKPINRRRHDHT